MATKQKSSTAESKPEQVLLRNLDNQESQGFAPDHAERLLAYPRTRWAAIAEAGNAPAGAAKTAPAAPSEADETGHPHAV